MKAVRNGIACLTLLLLGPAPLGAQTAIGDWGHFVLNRPRIFLNNPQGKAFTVTLHMLGWPVAEWNKPDVQAVLTGPDGKTTDLGTAPFVRSIGQAVKRPTTGRPAARWSRSAAMTSRRGARRRALTTMRSACSSAAALVKTPSLTFVLEVTNTVLKPRQANSSRAKRGSVSHVRYSFSPIRKATVGRRSAAK